MLKRGHFIDSRFQWIKVSLNTSRIIENWTEYIESMFYPINKVLGN